MWSLPVRRHTVQPRETLFTGPSRVQSLFKTHVRKPGWGEDFGRIVHRKRPSSDLRFDAYLEFTTRAVLETNEAVCRLILEGIEKHTSHVAVEVSVFARTLLRGTSEL